MSKYSATAVDGCAMGQMLHSEYTVASVPILNSLEPFDVTRGPPSPVINVQYYYFHNIMHPDGRKTVIWSIFQDFNETASNKHLSW